MTLRRCCQIGVVLLACASARAQDSQDAPVVAQPAPATNGSQVAFLVSTSVAVASSVIALGCGIGTGLLENAANATIDEWNAGAAIDPEEMRAIETNEVGFGVCTAVATAAVVGGVVGAVLSLPAKTAAVERNAE